MYDVAREFDVRGAVDPRPVPHITLFGPYNTDHGLEVKNRLYDIYEDYDIVPYRIDGFSRFKDAKVIYTKVVPSQELRDLRRDISRELRPVTYNCRPYDEDFYYDFHITIAFKDIDRQFEDIWEYVNEKYDPQYEAYAMRVTSIKRRKMMWEYDLLQDQSLSSDEATSAESWEKTTELLERYSTPDDHDQLAGSPGSVRYAKSAGARLLGRW